MKKLLTMIILGITLTSCEIYDNGNCLRRHEDHIWSVTGELFSSYGRGNIEGMEACIKIDDYIKADNEGKKDSRFSDIGFFATDNRYEIGDYYKVLPDGKSIMETGAVWECINGYITIRIECIGENEWAITPSPKSAGRNYPYSYIKPENISYSAHAVLVSKDSFLFCKWKYSVTGIYTEDSTYSARFGADDLDFWWQESSYHGTVSYTLAASGNFEAVFCINGKDTDRCVMHNNGTDWDRTISRL